jgi:hypothetical protein
MEKEGFLATACVKRFLITSIDSAFQSGKNLKEKEIVIKLARLFPIKKEGDFGLMTVSHIGNIKPTIDSNED